MLRKIYNDAQWRHMIREFMKVHRAETPYFLKLPEEFLAFLSEEYAPRDEDFAFLTELAHYEYAELALAVEPGANDFEGIDPDGDLLKNVPVKSVLAWTYGYRYPVHRISPEFLPTDPAEQPVYLTIYRRSDDQVRFLELNAVTAALLDAIGNNEDQRTGEALIRELAETIHYPDVNALIGHGAEALAEMRQLEILIGTRSAG